ncbi:hypothetical protein I4U23_018616 [Adineta vaga]|nr:hypothetical protein I4U23_018616 [Adineta vaga]
MALLSISIHRFIIFLILIQSVSLYKIYTLDDNQLNSLYHSVSSPAHDELSQEFPLKYLGYDNENVILNKDSYDNNVPLSSWSSILSDMKEQPVWQQSNSHKIRSVKPLPQRRNSRPHWNPLIAAYKRCGELPKRDERETCFKDAVQMLFVHKLRK